MTTTIIIFAGGMLLGCIIMFVAMHECIGGKYERMYQEKLVQLKGRQTRSMSDAQCFRLLQNIQTFVSHQYNDQYLRHHEWVEKAKIDGEWAILAFLRWVHGAGCRVVIEEMGREDVEQNPDQADEEIKYRYKSHYNHTFEQITGRSWLESDH